MQIIRGNPLQLLKLVVVIVSFQSSLVNASPQPRLFNADFDHGESGQVACEWSHWGDGTPIYRNGFQGITGLGEGQTGTIVQKVSHCVPGSIYSASIIVPTMPVSGMKVFIGIDPTGGADAAKTIWSNVQTIGETEISVKATGPVCSVILAMTNEGGESGEAYVDAVSFKIIQESPHSAFGIPTPIPAVAAVAQQRISEAFSLINRDQHDRAVAYFDSVLRNLSNSRPEAAMALVGLQEAAQGKQFEIYTKGIPKEQWQQHQGLDYLRAVAQLYPEQTSACALARTKIGEFYLEWQALPMASEILESAINDFPNTEGANWAKTQMLNCNLWQGKGSEMDDLYAQIEDDFSKGNLGIKQKGWADYFYLPRRLQKTGASWRGEAAFSLHEELWNTYKTSFPELAIRSKMENATRREENNDFSKAITDYRNIVETHPGDLQWSGGPRIRLAGILFNHGWKLEHKAEALALLHQVADTPDCPDHLRQQAQMDLELYQKPNGLRVDNIRWPHHDNLLYNGDFDAPPDPTQEDLHRYYPQWRIVQPSPNEVVHWSEDAPPGGLGKITPAWTTANLPEPATLEARLVHDINPMEGNMGYRAHVFVAAEGIGGCRADEVAFKLIVRFLDGFNGILSETTTGPKTPCSEPGRWQVIEVHGVTPADCRYAEVEVSAKSVRAGQFTAAITHVYLELTEDTPHAR